MICLRRTLFAAVLVGGPLFTAHAGVIIGGTRIVFDGNKKEAAININNPDASPYLIQSWIETVSGGAEKAPFIITPPLYRLDKGQQNVERIVMAGALPQDRESLFWLNIKAIPASSNQENTLQIAVKTRIKLIYRPTAIKGRMPEEQADKLVWRRVGNKLQVTNPTDFVMNFNGISVAGKALAEASYVLPRASTFFDFPSGVQAGEVTFNIINDYGSPGAIHKNTL
ncbi:TPA: fimbria/pilus periplasmic chaperone [Enterobacter asburiae]|nr:fimbria/pilus periplasmic chaperone [Enterobacter asburiae]